MYTKEQLIKIFERIGLEYSEELALDASLAAAVQYGFQKNIPYENLDIIRRKPLSLEYENLYEKIVTNHRGGYCFEINGFLAEVYRSLGFTVEEYMARYLRGETEIPVRRHRVCTVEADGAIWLCDAGIGQSAFRLPLKLENGHTSEQFGEIYRVEYDPKFFGWIVSDFHKGEWRRFYSFTEEKQLNIDYIMPSFWCEHADESPFRPTEMFSIKNDTGRITLDGNILHIFDGDDVFEKYLDEDEVREAYSKYFGLPYYENLSVKRYEDGSREAKRIDHAALAKKYFLDGFNCAQAVFCAFEDLTGYDREESLKTVSSFGGGLGRLREVCGAMSGAAAVAGALWGYSDLSDKNAKAEHYALIQRIAAEFKEANGSIICREMLKGIQTSTDPTPEDRTPEYYTKRPCAAVIERAAAIIDKIIEERGV